MKKIKLGISSILAILFSVILLMCTKTDFLVDLGIARSEINETDLELIIDEVKEGERCFVFSNTPKEDFNHVMDLIYDNPYLFWIDMKYRAISVGDLHIVVLREKYDNLDIKTKEIEQKIQAVASTINGNSVSDYDKVLAVHDWICNNVTYSKLENDADQDVYGALFEKRARCAGYAKLFTMLLDAVDIRSEVLSGEAVDADGETVAHAWNIVYIDDQPYYFDITWDDDDNGPINYSWFAVTKKEFEKKHFLSIGYDWVDATSTQHNYYRKNGMYMESYSNAFIVKMIQTQGKNFFIKCKNEQEMNRTIAALSSSSELQSIMRSTGITYIDSIKYEKEEGSNCLSVSIQ